MEIHENSSIFTIFFVPAFQLLADAITEPKTSQIRSRTEYLIQTRRILTAYFARSRLMKSLTSTTVLGLRRFLNDNSA